MGVRIDKAGREEVAGCVDDALPWGRREAPARRHGGDEAANAQPHVHGRVAGGGAGRARGSGRAAVGRDGCAPQQPRAFDTPAARGGSGGRGEKAAKQAHPGRYPHGRSKQEQRSHERRSRPRPRGRPRWSALSHSAQGLRRGTEGGGDAGRGTGRRRGEEVRVRGATRGDPESGGRRRRGQRSGAASASPSGARGASACGAVAERISAGENIKEILCRPELKTCCLSSGFAARPLPLSRVEDRIRKKHTGLPLECDSRCVDLAGTSNVEGRGIRRRHSSSRIVAARDGSRGPPAVTCGSRPAPIEVCYGPAFRLAQQSVRNTRDSRARLPGFASRESSRSVVQLT